MYVTKKEQISAEVIKNLLSAHKRVAEGGNVSELIKLSRYLLHVSSRPQQELMDTDYEIWLGGEQINVQKEKAQPIT